MLEILELKIIFRLMHELIKQRYCLAICAERIAQVPPKDNWLYSVDLADALCISNWPLTRLAGAFHSPENG